ncbi:hypothetical protein NQ315_006349 [Exocentrus adspersus]|uniref:Sugar phosphate phosphatase n=1 Tax=Exocentrus adspersus TaxID=1586481 RepID=A0AAV8W1A9_9CUCU|nr:hypothetical protein NQ315_006349 [Exocentrus adspersus]
MCECKCESFSIMDLKTPRNVYLTAFYKRSFAFYTVKNRMPIILTTLIDTLVRNKSEIIEQYGKAAKDELKCIIGELSEFKYEIQTNKPLKLLSSETRDAKLYNEYIERLTAQEGTPPTHFHTIWLLTECYMYRRIRQMFELQKSLHNFDPFRSKKEEAYNTALPMIQEMGEHFLNVAQNDSDADKEEFISLLKLNLWGNKCDLSITLGKVEEKNTLFDTASLDRFVLCDHSEKIWEAVSNSTSSSIIGETHQSESNIIFDNAGYEVFTDLCLADYLVTKKLASSVRLYVKTIPWFISDVMTHDLRWTLEELKSSGNAALQALGERWSNYLTEGVWDVVESDFWTLPFDYTSMKQVEPTLYMKLGEAKAAIFKGDLNYRKLFGERNWDPATTVDEGLQGFHPTKLCILRTIKADIVCGLEEGLAEKVEAEDAKWMETGDWGLVQFSGKVVQIHGGAGEV